MAELIRQHHSFSGRQQRRDEPATYLSGGSRSGIGSGSGQERQHYYTLGHQRRDALTTADDDPIREAYPDLDLSDPGLDPAIGLYGGGLLGSSAVIHPPGSPLWSSASLPARLNQPSGSMSGRVARSGSGSGSRGQPSSDSSSSVLDGRAPPPRAVAGSGKVVVSESVLAAVSPYIVHVLGLTWDERRHALGIQKAKVGTPHKHSRLHSPPFLLTSPSTPVRPDRSLQRWLN